MRKRRVCPCSHCVERVGDYECASYCWTLLKWRQDERARQNEEKKEIKKTD